MIYKISRFSKTDTREDASPEVIEKAKKSGVVQKINGDWRIVSIKKGKLWPQIYISKASGEKALKGYHASKGFSKTYPYTGLSKKEKSSGFRVDRNGNGYLTPKAKREVEDKVDQYHSENLGISLSDYIDNSYKDQPKAQRISYGLKYSGQKYKK